jgi:Prenyltransferase and squalene oxidase repeat
MSTFRIASALCIILGIGLSPTRAEDQKIKVDETIRKGLEFLAKTQAEDGSFSSNGTFPAALTGMAGTVFLMEGSTPQEGRYASSIKKAIEYIESNAQASGLLCSLRNPSENSRYMIGHGYAALFLATAWHENTNEKRRAQLQLLVEKALQFTASAQNSKGGWGYVSARDGGDFDEGCSSLTQLQALLAAKKMGLKVPQNAIDKARRYFREATCHDGGVRYGSMQPAQAGNGRPALTAGAAACSFTEGDFAHRDLKAWIAYCQKNIPFSRASITNSSNEFTFHYFSHVVYVLGDDGHKKLVPDMDDNDALKWSRFRSEVFKTLHASQQPDGSWTGSSVGTVYRTIVNLSVLQLENGILPAYQR